MKVNIAWIDSIASTPSRRIQSRLLGSIDPKRHLHRYARGHKPGVRSHGNARHVKCGALQHFPELIETAARHSWEITKFAGPSNGRHFDGYVMFDIYSRYMVGARVRAHESDFLAGELVEQIFAVRRIPNPAHADHETWKISNTRRGARRGSRGDPLALTSADLKRQGLPWSYDHQIVHHEPSSDALLLLIGDSGNPRMTNSPAPKGFSGFTGPVPADVGSCRCRELLRRHSSASA